MTMAGLAFVAGFGFGALLMLVAMLEFGRRLVQADEERERRS